jgi:uncharacterized protein YifE (UPF0438 family)
LVCGYTSLAYNHGFARVGNYTVKEEELRKLPQQRGNAHLILSE